MYSVAPTHITVDSSPLFEGSTSSPLHCANNSSARIDEVAAATAANGGLLQDDRRRTHWLQIFGVQYQQHHCPSQTALGPRNHSINTPAVQLSGGSAQNIRGGSGGGPLSVLSITHSPQRSQIVHLHRNLLPGPATGAPRTPKAHSPTFPTIFNTASTSPERQQQQAKKDVRAASHSSSDADSAIDTQRHAPAMTSPQPHDDAPSNNDKAPTAFLTAAAFEEFQELQYRYHGEMEREIEFYAIFDAFHHGLDRSAMETTYMSRRYWIAQEEGSAFFTLQERERAHLDAVTKQVRRSELIVHETVQRGYRIGAWYAGVDRLRQHGDALFFMFAAEQRAFQSEFTVAQDLKLHDGTATTATVREEEENQKDEQEGKEEIPEANAPGEQSEAQDSDVTALVSPKALHRYHSSARNAMRKPAPPATARGSSNNYNNKDAATPAEQPHHRRISPLSALEFLIIAEAQRRNNIELCREQACAFFADGARRNCFHTATGIDAYDIELAHREDQRFIHSQHGDMLVEALQCVEVLHRRDVAIKQEKRERLALEALERETWLATRHADLKLLKRHERREEEILTALRISYGEFEKQLVQEQLNLFAAENAARIGVTTEAALHAIFERFMTEFTAAQEAQTRFEMHLEHLATHMQWTEETYSDVVLQEEQLRCHTLEDEDAQFRAVRQREALDYLVARKKWLHNVAVMDRMRTQYGD